ncbi:hypothetical protein L3X38_041836 [Prunus dulcis]|uniref:Uncharacterized protein n=1 Tax=Prunus dulcis TaxID=3755 RepID=A0AAD4UVP3_PRUDU|nr:hypothetical protein L3X38_041836 [Prunus dulcis]
MQKSILATLAERQACAEATQSPRQIDQVDLSSDSKPTRRLLQMPLAEECPDQLAEDTTGSTKKFRSTLADGKGCADNRRPSSN